MSKPSCSERALSALLLALAAAPALAEIEMPVGGWRQGNAEAPYSQEVNYPASRPAIDAGVPGVAQIRGRIARHTKGPATLVVNGNAMPLEVDEEGRYGRAYSFATGSNSVEVRAGDGRPQRVQFYQTAAGQAEARLRVVLSWDTDGTDLDLHLITPDGEHAWYGNRAVKGGAIDVDVTTGYGPEIFASPAPLKGPYQIWVNYYGGGRGEMLTTARVAVISNEGTSSERRQEFDVPMRAAGELTLVRQFVYP
ncbi:YfaP family protein [Azoarcus olearius]|uniref:Conserved hypothetical secreted protein n=1 Tax=Azoarcus sp. (strain BH72) TaxID=418699 RepID=A1K1G0_AZOSB|nr:DUF2135 domain-containing protein [Azoarcus olearius]CAL92665.1 conserved hypothetical secreted protein [Azoarcus olearius]